MQHRGYIEDEQTAIISGKPDFVFVDISYMALLSFRPRLDGQKEPKNFVQ
jgi:hypothetical protein